jgi:predicted DNA-binding transcriptional regulator YafY
MMNIEILAEPATKLPKELNFDMSEYCQHSFHMFGGEDTRVQLLCDKSLINPVIDRFGKDVMIHQVDENTARIYTSVAKSSMFFGWLTQFADQMKIESPKSLAKEYLEYLRTITRIYNPVDS